MNKAKRRALYPNGGRSPRRGSQSTYKPGESQQLVREHFDGVRKTYIKHNAPSGAPIYHHTAPVYEHHGFKQAGAHPATADVHAANAQHVLSHPYFAGHTAADHNAVAAYHENAAHILRGQGGEAPAHVAVAHRLAAKTLGKSEGGSAITLAKAGLGDGGLSKGQKCLGAAFAHARKVAQKTGGGRQKEREVANRYLKKKGHSSMGKAMPVATFGQYAQALGAQAQATSADQQYDWKRYMDLFALNRQNTERLRNEAAVRNMLAQQAMRRF